jgi:hypothetical protein
MRSFECFVVGRRRVRPHAFRSWVPGRSAPYARAKDGKRWRLIVTGYRPMTLADLAGRLIRTSEGKVRWKLVREFLEEYRWEPADVQPSLLQQAPPPVGDKRWMRWWRRVSPVGCYRCSSNRTNTEQSMSTRMFG